MKKLIRNSIIIVSIIIVILLISIILIKLKEENQREQQEAIEVETAEKVKIEEIEVEQRVYMYLYSNDILNRVFDYISEKEVNVKNEEAIINLLDVKYKEEKKINENNVLDLLKEYKGIDSYFSKEIYKKEIAQRQNINGNYFYIKGIIRKDGQEEYIYVLMKQDLVNSTYSISIMNEEEFNKKGQENEEISIEKNDYNSIYSKGISDYEICLSYLNDYINTIQNNPNNGYELLNKEYKNSRFQNKENYIAYINDIKDNLSNIVLKGYSIEKNQEQIQYVCTDQRGNYYIFEKKEMMNYTVILDTYTIDLPQFIEKYNSSNDMEKVGYNIQRCIEAINNKDYSYVYSKLDNTFKENNFKTLESFEKHIKENLFKNNSVTDVSSSNEGNTYIYNLTIGDIDNTKNQKNMTIIMQLKDGTDFVMSFSFE